MIDKLFKTMIKVDIQVNGKEVKRETKYIVSGALLRKLLSNISISTLSQIQAAEIKEKKCKCKD